MNSTKEHLQVPPSPNGKVDGASFLGQGKKKKIGEKSTHRAKDELEFATNWSRVFVNIYQHLKWLNAYAIINEVAV